MNREERYINKLVKDICKRSDITYEGDVEYIRLTLTLAYWKGRVDSNNFWNKPEYDGPSGMDEIRASENL